MIPKEESKVEQNLDPKEIMKSEKKAEKKEYTSKQSFIEIKLNLFDFKEKAEKKIKKVDDNPVAINFNHEKSEKTKENANIMNTQNTTNINSSYAKKDNERTDNSNNSHNLSLFEKLMKNNIIKPKKNSDQINFSSNNDRNKTSDNISNKFLNTNQSDESSFIINNKLNNNNKEENVIKKNKTENNFSIQSILNFGKTNNISIDKSKLLSSKLKEKNKKRDKIDNIPLWIENENNDLDFSVNTVCYEKKDNKLNSMPNNFMVDPYSITDHKSDNSNIFIKKNKKNINGHSSKLDNTSSGTKNSKEKFAFNVNKSQNFNHRPQSGVLFENEENNKHFLTNYENFKNTYTDSNDSLISNYSKISSEKLNDIQIISGNNDGYDSGEETVFIRREDSNNKKEEKNEILIVIKI